MRQKGDKGKGMEINVILVILTLWMFWSRIQWKLVALCMIYYMDKKQYERPNKKELKECAAFAVKDLFKNYRF